MKYFISLAFSFILVATQAQQTVRRLPNTINHPSINVYAPYISLDANTLAFISDNAEDNALTLYYTFRENGDWKNPIMAPKLINSRLNFLKGFALSADGSKLYYTSMKSPVVGGYDIFVSDFKNGSWAEPKNMGMPISSKANDGAPSFTFDGNTLYLMRCEKMTSEKAEGCKIFVTKKKSNGVWDEPVELPSTINTGNSQTPRIMADGETLIFSSDKFPNNKGGMDLYMTRLQNGSWSSPVPFVFANTESDDQYVSVNALGRYLLKDSQGARKREINEYLIPDNIRPKGMMKVEGKALDATGKPAAAYVSVLDVGTKKRIYNGRPDASGAFLVYLIEGGVYELSVDPELGNISYFSKQFDLMNDKFPQVEKVSAILKPIAVGDETILDMVKFKPNSSVLEDNSLEELKRLSRLIKKNPELKFEIQVLLSGYQEAAAKSNPDFTEVTYDSIATQVDEIDSLGRLYKKDSLIMKTTFHNDRTAKQAKALIDFLVSQGDDSNNLSFFRNAIEATSPENKRLTIKVLARKK